MQYRLFDGIDAGAVTAFLANQPRAFYKAKEAIFHQGDEAGLLYLLEDGHVSVKMDLGTGDSLSMQILGPGGFFGEVGILSEPATRHISIRATDAVTVVKIPKDRFDDFRHLHPVLNDTLLASMGRTIRLLYAQLAELSSENVEIRLLRRLLDVAEIFGRGPASAGVSMPLTQQDVADLVGTSRPTASTLLQEAQRRGFVKLERGKITIVDAEKLENRSGRRPE